VQQSGSVDWVGILESIYDVEQPREQWLAGVLRAACHLSSGGAGIGGVLYDVSSEAGFRLDFITGLELPPGWLAAGVTMHTDPAFYGALAQSYRQTMCASSREFLAGDGYPQRFALESMAGAQLEEAQCVNGMDGSGLGCALYLFSRTPLALSSEVVGLLKRIASHLATAYRLQRRISGASVFPGHVEAVLGDQGQLLHAEGDAKEPEARSRLAHAAAQYRWAHGKARHEQPRPAVAARQAMVSGRWTLREHAGSDGSSLIHAHANPPIACGPSVLSAREQQVAALAALGRSNKLIAYELGLAHSTVRVLMARAARKLGAHSRLELIARLRRADALAASAER
jgi:DNA-binding CsgD family transcriptional regulator